jgi:hypothetical protein
MYKMLSDEYLAGFRQGLKGAPYPQGAYDAKPRYSRDGGFDRDTANRICEYLEPLLDPEDYSRVEEMIHECVDEEGEDDTNVQFDAERLARDRGRRAQDQPPPFKGMPRTGGRMVDDRRGRAMDAILATGPAMAFDKKLSRIGRARRSFEARYPDVKRIGFR